MLCHSSPVLPQDERTVWCTFPSQLELGTLVTGVGVPGDHAAHGQLNVPLGGPGARAALRDVAGLRAGNHLGVSVTFLKIKLL